MLLIVPLGSFAESPPVFPTEEAAEVKQRKFLFFFPNFKNFFILQDECCMDDGRLVDTSFAGALAALIM